jgi:hypothetical protein
VISDALYAALNGLRNEYRTAMNKATDAAAAAAEIGDMIECSIHSSESARKSEAFTAMNRAVKIVEEAFAEGGDIATLQSALAAMVDRWEPDCTGTDRALWEAGCRALGREVQ